MVREAVLTGPFRTPAPPLESERTRKSLRQASALLEEVVRLLEGVRDAEARGYGPGPHSNSPASTDMSEAELREFRFG